MTITRSLHSQRAAARRKHRHSIYTSARWRHCRRAVLEDAGYTCVLCGNPATITDHHPRTMQQLLDQGIDPCDPTHCRALCHQCSGKEDGAGTTHA